MALSRIRPRRALARTLAGLLLTIGLLVGFSGCIADALILGSNRQRIDPGGLRREELHVGGRAVECWVAHSEGMIAKEPEGFVLFFVGKSDRAERWTAAVAGAWREYPVEVWGLNYPGSGGSTPRTSH